MKWASLLTVTWLKNSVPCCTRCNVAKSSLHPKAFEQWIMDLYYHCFEGAEVFTYNPIEYDFTRDTYDLPSLG